MEKGPQSAIITDIRHSAYPLTGTSKDYGILLDFIGDARFVLLGEASHGTHEFYHTRAEITKRLITEKGFAAVAVEADWPDAYRINRYVHGDNDDKTGEEALASFQRFPTWMWRNRDILAFVEWLRMTNQRKARHERKTGFYGLDLYSLYRSMGAVIDYLEKVDPEAAKRARYRYSCFDHYNENTQAYGYATGFHLSQSCEEKVIHQLVELQHHTPQYVMREEGTVEDEFFYAEQNARLVKNAEHYYRTMFSGDISSWNIRDQHMVETLQALVSHLDQKVGKAKVVVWAHNSHLGDARATEMGKAGEWNVGQLVRERYNQDAFLIGFSTYIGTVTAASDWGAIHERKRVRPALPESYEALFHKITLPHFILPLHREEQIYQILSRPRLERAIGVIYRPQSERVSHYFSANLPDQFDVIIHYDHTHAVEPLDRIEQWQKGDVPETYPSAL